MTTSPDHTASSPEREKTARCLMDYLEQLPMPMEQRLTLALDVLRDLPLSASPTEALAALHTLLPKRNLDAYPPSHPDIDRGHMPAQYMGSPRTGFRGLVARWGWITVVILLLALTLLLNLYQ